MPAKRTVLLNEYPARRIVIIKPSALGDIIHALRVAVTGKAVGPGLYDCLAILGRETCLTRIQRTIDDVSAGAA